MNQASTLSSSRVLTFLLVFCIVPGVVGRTLGRTHTLSGPKGVSPVHPQSSAHR